MMFGLLRVALPSTAAPRVCLVVARALSASAGAIDAGTIEAAIDKNLVTIALPLAGGAKTLFHVPLRSPVKQLVSNVREEDQELTACRLFTASGDAISLNTPLSAVVSQPFKILLNDRVYSVPALPVPTASNGVASEEADGLLARTAAALGAFEASQAKRQEIVQKIHTLEAKLKPMENIRVELEDKGRRAGNRMAWMGLAFMSVQFGFMARLTWWDYSWDIMEPVTYFVGYGTSMLYFAYYVATKAEFGPLAVTDRHISAALIKRAAKSGLDVQAYNKLVDELHDAQTDLKKNL
eukprot:m.241806 g.241806  ORF g.241806 m.241806 type:complete len:295 (-) comp13922_c0_seq1:56-940(-)